MEKTRGRESTPHGGEPEEVELIVRRLGGKTERVRVPVGTKLKDWLKKEGIETKGLSFFFQGKKLAVNEEGELEDNPEITTDSLLEILLEKVTGGKM